MKIVTGMVRLDQIRGHRCAWKGCTATTPIADDLPRGWRWLLLFWSADPVALLPLGGTDRDAVLCPKHASQLHNDLLEDIGQRLDTTQGSA